MGKKFSRPTDYVRYTKENPRGRACGVPWLDLALCKWLIKPCNDDLMKACDTHDTVMMESCLNSGAWLDYHLQDNFSEDTALHLFIQNCEDYKDYVERGKELGLGVQKDGTGQEHIVGALDGALETDVKPRNDAERQRYIEEIAEWKQQHEQELLGIHILVGQGGTCPYHSIDKWDVHARQRPRGYCDPLLKNAEGKTALDMAEQKDPLIKEYLEIQVENLDNLRKFAAKEDMSGGKLVGEEEVPP